MPHFLDGNWNLFTGLVAQIEEVARTHTTNLTTTELTWTPPATEKYRPLTATELRERRYRAHVHWVTTTASSGGTTPNFLVRVEWTDPLGFSRIYSPSAVSCATAGTTSSYAVDIWAKPGTAINIKSACTGGTSPTTAAVVKITAALEGI